MKPQLWIPLLTITCAVAVFFMLRPHQRPDNYWRHDDSWYFGQPRGNEDYADVIYFVSTNIIESHDAEGNKSMTAVLDSAEIETLSLEIAHMQHNVFPDSLNFFAPFYHQATMEAIVGPVSEAAPVMYKVYGECIAAFNFYFHHMNHGRPFILAGFSQGAMIVKEILKNMTDKQYSQLVAAYVLGEEITEEDILNPHIVPATGPRDKGVTISFNSVCGEGATANPGSIWDLVSGSPAACINPVNWCTDATPAPLASGKFNLSVALDTTRNVVVVSGYGDNWPRPAFAAPWPDGCLHGQEILIYNQSLSRNVLDRCYR